MTIENSSRSNSMKVWDRAGIELMTPGSAITTYCSMGPDHFDLIGSKVGLGPYLRSTVAQ